MTVMCSFTGRLPPTGIKTISDENKKAILPFSHFINESRLYLITLRYSDIFRRHGIQHYYLFANDMQGHCRERLDDVPAIVSLLESCIVDIYAWCGVKRLQLKADKTRPTVVWTGVAAASAAISQQ